MIKHSTAIMVSHNLIKKDYGKNIHGSLINFMGEIKPSFDNNFVYLKLFNNKKFGIEITGTITEYRSSILQKINKFIKIHLIRESLIINELSFNSLSINTFRTSYSLHPPQAKNWKYSSPTRIYRALVIDNNIPITTQTFNQSSIESICLEFNYSAHFIYFIHKLYNDQNFLDSVYKPKLSSYIQLADNNNEELFTKIINLKKQ